MTIQAVIEAQAKRLIWYDIVSTKIRTAVTLEHRGKCSCSSFGVKGRCWHTDYFNDRDYKWDCVHQESGEDIPIRKGEVGVVVALKEGGTELRLLPPPKAGVHIYEVLDTVAAERSVTDLPGMSEERSYVRLRTELAVALKESRLLDSPSITTLQIDGEDSDALDIDELREVWAGKTPEPKKTPSVVKGPWSKIERPSTFWVAQEVWEILLWTILVGRNAIILGPTGGGKSEVVYHAAVALGLDIIAINFGATQEARLSLIGATHFDKNKGTYFRPSRFVRAVQQEAGVVLLDEITRASRDASNILFPLMDDQRYVALDEAEDGEVVRRGKKVAFVATANVGYEYTGTDALDRAWLDRCNTKITMDYLPPEKEVEIIQQRYPKAPKAVVRKLVSASDQQRQMWKAGDFDIAISTRMDMDAAHAMNDGITPKSAVRFAIVECFSGEGGAGSERVKLLQLFTKSAKELV